MKLSVSRLNRNCNVVKLSAVTVILKEVLGLSSQVHEPINIPVFRFPLSSFTASPPKDPVILSLSI